MLTLSREKVHKTHLLKPSGSENRKKEGWHYKNVSTLPNHASLGGNKFNEKTSAEKTPEVAGKILQCEIEGDQMHTEWEFTSVIVQFNF